MKKCIMAMLFISPLLLNAQHKKREVQLTGAGYFAKGVKKGIGLGFKNLYSLSEKDYITAGISFNLFQLKTGINNSSENKKTLPLLAGYQRRFGNFYLEPQLGYGFYSGKYFLIEDARPSKGALFLGAETGYIIKKVTLSLKFMSSHISADKYLGKSFSYGGMGISYRLSGNE